MLVFLCRGHAFFWRCIGYRCCFDIPNAFQFFVFFVVGFDCLFFIYSLFRYSVTHGDGV
jgi:hypothetical protein